MEGSEAATHSILSNIYESLVSFDKDMRLRPTLAMSWSNLDERTWLIQLREGVRFHDGRRLSSADVRFTLERARSDPASGVKGQLWSLDAVEVLDGRTLKLRTLRSDPLLMVRLTYILIVPARGPEADPMPPVGTPYRFVRWDKGRVLEVEAFEDYWGGRPRIDRVQFLPVEQGAQSVRALKEGRVDVLRDVPETMEDAIASLPGIRVLSRPGLASTYLWFSTRKEPGAANPFSDRRVRQAVSLAIDRAAITRGLGGRGIAADQIVQKGVFGYFAGLPPLDFDAGRSRALLKEAGHSRGFDATLIHSSGTSAAAVTGMLRAMLGQVGIRLTLQNLEWPEMVSRWKAGSLPSSSQAGASRTGMSRASSGTASRPASPRTTTGATTPASPTRRWTN